jgi:hypothetical protein
LGFEIANVTAPTRRTFHSCACGVLPSVSIVCSQFLFEVTAPQLYSGFELRATAGCDQTPHSIPGGRRSTKRHL